MSTRNLTCIGCPMGCQLTAELAGGEVVSVRGNTCARGEAYARKECTHPARTVTGTVRCEGGVLPVVSVRTADEVPKEKVFDVARALGAVTVRAPLHIGDVVLAIGNPYNLGQTITQGIISATGRIGLNPTGRQNFLQTDASINHGNSGGPLINSSGQVIGINSAKMSSTYSGEATVEGIGFAIPMSEAKSIVDDLINYGYVTGRPQLGISCQDVTEAVSQAYNIPVGAYIFSVTAGGAADQAGLQPGDVITGIQDQTISTTEELNAVKNQYKAGDTITLTYVRAGETKKVDVTLAEVQQTENN